MAAAVSAIAQPHAAVTFARTALQALLHHLAKTSPPDSSRYIGGIAGLNARSTTRMSIETVPMPVLVPAIQGTLTIDEAAVSGHPLHTLTRLIESYFLRYVDGDCIQLVVMPQRRMEIDRGVPLLGPEEFAFV